MKSKVLKSLLTLVVVLMAAMAAYAESIPVKKDRETIGYVTLSYEIQTTSRGGAFVHVTASNSTKESVSVYVTTNKGGGQTIHLRGYEDNKTTTFGVDEVPTRVYAVEEHINVR